jgi:hypothetical protein
VIQHQAPVARELQVRASELAVLRGFHKMRVHFESSAAFFEVRCELAQVVRRVELVADALLLKDHISPRPQWPTTRTDEPN